MKRPGFLLLALFVVLAGAAQARGTTPAALPEIAVAELPAEARETIQLIGRGGPFPYERDGTVFGNFEKLLPLRERGYYREYTVRTPGLQHRGARRIVAGSAGELYYTDDHYRSFRRVRE
ncbi:MAG: ribonuclease N [Betaproteobacteria bacterium]|nr:ribonuclease N [Betaproteobacteria bacterium]